MVFTYLAFPVMNLVSQYIKKMPVYKPGILFCNKKIDTLLNALCKREKLM